ncbi:hypothetical protein HDU83_003338 [Entophlyctis luteolus]|nr:hypothetical protein HDU83_003338 [Entophlyctis luteolus]
MDRVLPPPGERLPVPQPLPLGRIHHEHMPASEEPFRDRSFDLEGFNYELDRLRHQLAKSNLNYGKATGLKATRSSHELASSSEPPPTLSPEAAAQASRLYEAHLKYLSMQGQRQRSANASFSGSTRQATTPDPSKDNSASPQARGYKLKPRGSSCLPPLDRVPSPSSTGTPPQLTMTPPSGGRSGAVPNKATDSPTFTYPSASATLLILLTNDGLHGSLHRSRPIPTTPNVATKVPPEILIKKKSGGVINSLFKNSASTFLSPPGLVNCVIVLIKRRLYVFDVVKKNGLRRGPVPGPRTSETLFSAPPHIASQGSQVSQGSLPLKPVARFRRDSKKSSLASPTSPTDSESSARSSSSSFTSSPSTIYSPELLAQKPVMILDLMNACVAEDGVWILRLSGFDMIRNGAYFDVYLQAFDCDEMLRWLQVLRSVTR